MGGEKNEEGGGERGFTEGRRGNMDQGKNKKGKLEQGYIEMGKRAKERLKCKKKMIGMKAKKSKKEERST